MGSRPSVSGWHLHLYQVLPYTESSGPSLEWVLGAQRGIAVPSLSCGLRPGCILSLGDREDWVYISTSFPSFSFLSAHLYLLCARSPQIQSLSDSIFSEPKPSVSCLEGGHGGGIHISASIGRRNSGIYISLCRILRDTLFLACHPQPLEEPALIQCLS